MVDARSLSPEELDTLEDALEQIELGESSPPLEGAVRERLLEYRRLLEMTRDALPLEAPPAGLAARVLSTAATEATTPTPAAAPETAGRWRKFRRRFLLPMLSVAGSAALILLVVQPDPQAPSPTLSESSAPEPRQQAAMLPAEEISPSAEAPSLDQLELGDMAAEAAPEPELELEEGRPAPAASSPVPSEKSDQAARYGGVSRKKEAAPTARPRSPMGRAESDAPPPPAPAKRSTASQPKLEPPARGMDEDALGPSSSAGGRSANEGQVVTASEWQTIAAGDKARLGGDCTLANSKYRRVLGSDDASVRARAYAGLGLCAAQSGAQAQARSYFDRAVELDPSVSRMIGSEDRLAPSENEKQRRPAPADQSEAK